MKRNHIDYEYVQTNDAKPEVVFPLLCPLREVKWVPGWRYSLLHSESGHAETGCVFTTPNEDGTDSTWVCAHYDPKTIDIAFVWVRPGRMATRITIHLEPVLEDKTLARIRYEYTGLSAAGDSEIEKYDRAWFDSKMVGWEKAINHYLRTGECISGKRQLKISAV